MTKSAADIVADAVLPLEDENAREQMTMEIASHCAAMLILLKGPKAASEMMYRVADAAVRQWP